MSEDKPKKDREVSSGTREKYPGMSESGIRRHLQASLEDRLAFESVLLELSATFVNIPADQVDTRIHHGLQQLVDSLGADRAVITSYAADRQELRITHSYARPGIESAPAVTIAESVSVLVERLKSGEIFMFSSVDDLPQDLGVEKVFFKSLGTKSQITVPLIVGGAFLGTLSMGTLEEEREWPDQIVHRLRLIAEVFANALERRRMEVEKRDMRREIEHAGRVTAMGEVAAGLAHELRQPLTAIMSNAQAAKRFLTSDNPDMDEVREIIDDIIADNQRAADVMSRLRDFMKKNEMERGPVDVREVIEDVVALLRSDFVLKNIELKLEFDEVPKIVADRVQLQQVLLNLIMNASESMLEVDPGVREMLIRTFREDDMVCVSVRDSGVGISEASLKRLFERFYTTKPDGMGMGLAINQTIVESHGGRMWAERNEEKGATFYFTMPIEGN
jgi:signal transduction histidine kinase